MPSTRAAARLALAGAAAGLFGLATWRAATSPEPDYVLHTQWARELAEGGWRDIPHPLFHLLTAAVHSLLPLGLADRLRPGLAAAWAEPSYLFAGLLVASGAYVALALVLERGLADARSSQTRRGAWAAAGRALAVMLLGPISVFTWHKHQLYLGYIVTSVFHNPTMTLLRPLAVAWFSSVVSPRSGSERRWLVVGLLALFATLAKPSFAVAFLPALVMWLVLGRKWPRAVDAGAGFVSLLVAAAVLSVQAWVRGGQPSLLVVAPLEVMGFYSARWQMPFLLVLSIAFPLGVVVSHWRAARRDGPLLLAWLVFAFGAAYGYLLVEAEPNAGDGNWLWSGQIALLVLMAQSVVFLRSQAASDAPRSPRAIRLCWIVFALQLACGIVWYAAEVIQPHEWWFPFSDSAE